MAGAKALQRPALGVHAARRAGRRCRRTPLERGLADLWARTAGPMPPARAARSARAVEDMTDSWMWELANQTQNRIPDPVDYIEMRRKTFGSDLTMSLSRLAPAGSSRPRSTSTRPIAALENSAADYACLLNDVFSYQKEIEFEGEIHNCVLVVQNFLDCDAATAMRGRRRPDDRAHAASSSTSSPSNSPSSSTRSTSTRLRARRCRAMPVTWRTGSPGSSTGTRAATATPRPT